MEYLLARKKAEGFLDLKPITLGRIFLMRSKLKPFLVDISVLKDIMFQPSSCTDLHKQ